MLSDNDNIKLKIISDQKLFFNLNVKKRVKKQPINELFNLYVNKEQYYGFKWISDCKSILDYGCGTGTTIDAFLSKININDHNFYGVDIAQNAIKEAKKKYPHFQFYKITNNKIPQIKDKSLDAIVMFHVLHHSRNHVDIFKEIHSKLKKGGKLLINDLSSNNLINKLGRSLFIHLPRTIVNKFDDDLVLDGKIPEKYKVDIALVVSQLKQCGFSIEEIGYGHLFFFIFIWIDRFVPISKIKLIFYIYQKLINFEKVLLQYDFFKNHAEVFYIKCIKQ